MSSPLSNLKKEKKAPINKRQAPYKLKPISEDDLISCVLQDEKWNGKSQLGAPQITNHDLMSSMMSRLTSLEKELAYFEESNREKDKKIKILEEKCDIYRKAHGDEINEVAELQRKCSKLQRQIHSMETFLEDYGMIWVGTNNSSDDEEDDGESYSNDRQLLWNPDRSFVEDKPFRIDYDLVLRNIEELNNIAGEGEHFIKRTTDGARLQVREPVQLTFFANGILMFNGPFRPFEDRATQICIQDLMDGYFPSELQKSYPDGVPFRVHDKRTVQFMDKRMERLFPGQGYMLSPEKSNTTKTISQNSTSELSLTSPKLPNVHRNIFLSTNTPQTSSTETKSTDYSVNMDRFLCSIPSSVVKNGKIIDLRGDLRDKLQENPTKNDVLIVETDVVKSMKTRLSSGRKSHPQTPGNVTTLRIKSEKGDITYVMKMMYSQTIEDVRKHLDDLRDPASNSYDLKTSFPNRVYVESKKTLRICGLVPNATLHMVPRK